MKAYAFHLLGVRRPSRTPDTAHTEVVRHSGVDFGNKCAGIGFWIQRAKRSAERWMSSHLTNFHVMATPLSFAVFSPLIISLEARSRMNMLRSSFFTLLPKEILNAGMLTVRHTTLPCPDKSWTPNHGYIHQANQYWPRTLQRPLLVHTRRYIRKHLVLSRTTERPSCSTQVSQDPKSIYVLTTKSTTSWSASSPFRCACCKP